MDEMEALFEMEDQDNQKKIIVDYSIFNQIYLKEKFSKIRNDLARSNYEKNKEKIDNNIKKQPKIIGVRRVIGLKRGSSGGGEPIYNMDKKLQVDQSIRYNRKYFLNMKIDWLNMINSLEYGVD